MRILSLISSSTEIIYSLGLGSKIIGRSHECDYPPHIRRLPFCTEPRFDINGNSLQILNNIKSLLQDALSIFLIDEKKLNELKPDIIITQSQCEVCAVSLNDLEKAVENIIGKSPKIVSTEPHSLDDVWKDVLKIGIALNVEKKAHSLIQKLKLRIQKLKSLTRGLNTPSVVCIEWIEPLMAAGNWVPELVKLANGINLIGSRGEHSPWIDIKKVVDQNPDKIIIMPCGYNIEKTESEMSSLTIDKEWNSLRAVQNNQVYITDGNQYFNRPGPRLIDSLEILVEIIHNQKYNFGHENIGWKKFL
tara:strand:+ start:2873 stop:3784 length:912 start_codon:yes stop_codon:yes gene_type:complete